MVQYTHTAEQRAEGLTKPLTKPKHNIFVKILGLQIQGCVTKELNKSLDKQYDPGVMDQTILGTQRPNMPVV
jgi:hypothetical protein